MWHVPADIGNVQSLLDTKEILPVVLLFTHRNGDHFTIWIGHALQQDDMVHGSEPFVLFGK